MRHTDSSETRLSQSLPSQSVPQPVDSQGETPVATGEGTEEGVPITWAKIMELGNSQVSSDVKRRIVDAIRKGEIVVMNETQKNQIVLRLREMCQDDSEEAGLRRLSAELLEKIGYTQDRDALRHFIEREAQQSHAEQLVELAI